MIHYPYNTKQDMRPIPPAPARYRIKEFKGVFTIEKLVCTKIKSKTICDWIWSGRYKFELDYHILNMDNLFVHVFEIIAKNNKQEFNSLEEAKTKLKQIKSETEEKYHFF